MEFTDEESRTAWDLGAEAWASFVRTGADWYRIEVHGPALLRACNVRKGEVALDLGAGEGWFSRALSRAGARVTGVELAPRMATLAREASIAEGLPIDIRCDSASRLEQQFEAESFDLVTSCMAIQDMSDIEACLRGCAHVLRDSGRLVFSVPHPASDMSVRRWQRDENGAKRVLEVDRYFETGAATCEWTMARLMYAWTTPYWRRTIEEWSRLIAEAGFLIRGLLEPRPDPSQVASRPQLDDCARVPYFLIFELVLSRSS